jgi:hypothetical protein
LRIEGLHPRTKERLYDKNNRPPPSGGGRRLSEDRPKEQTDAARVKSGDDGRTFKPLGRNGLRERVKSG